MSIKNDLISSLIEAYSLAFHKKKSKLEHAILNDPILSDFYYHSTVQDVVSLCFQSTITNRNRDNYLQKAKIGIIKIQDEFNYQ